MINVSWDDAKEYVAWLSKKTGKSYRLLTEAEWEYAARAGTTTRYAFGDTINFMQAQFWDNVYAGAGMTAEVGSRDPSAFALHDMHGNVEEWVEDCYSGGYKGAPMDGSASTSGDCRFRVIRGGSWHSGPGLLDSYFRFGLGTFVRVNTLGFRVGRTLER